MDNYRSLVKSPQAPRNDKLNVEDKKKKSETSKAIFSSTCFGFTPFDESLPTESVNLEKWMKISVENKVLINWMEKIKLKQKFASLVGRRNEKIRKINNRSFGETKIHKIAEKINKN